MWSSTLLSWMFAFGARITLSIYGLTLDMFVYSARGIKYVKNMLALEVWSCFNDSPYVHSLVHLRLDQWTVNCITCDRMEAVEFSPCVTNVESIHGGRSPVKQWSLVWNVIRHQWANWWPILRLNNNLTTNSKNTGIYRWNWNTKFAENGRFNLLTLKRSSRKRENSTRTTVELTGTTMLVD